MATLKGRLPNGETLVADLFVQKSSVISAICPEAVSPSLRCVIRA